MKNQTIGEILTAGYFGSDQTRSSWVQDINPEFDSCYMRNLRNFLMSERGKIYPAYSNIFRAFGETPLTEVKVVIIGQDPYYNGTADGLAFSKRNGNWGRGKHALLQIFATVRKDGYSVPSRPCSLSPWARQGVLLLNSVLTVRKGCAGSHRSQGWEKFTDKVVEIVSDKQDFVIFLLWGNQAKEKKTHIDSNKHEILEACHPNAWHKNARDEKFQDIKHFSKANDLLKEKTKGCISWSLC